MTGHHWGGVKKMGGCANKGRGGMWMRQRVKSHEASSFITRMKRCAATLCPGDHKPPVQGPASTNQGSSCPPLLVPLGLSTEGRSRWSLGGWIHPSCSCPPPILYICTGAKFKK